jgi:sugar lactone lactonase YvrE
MMQGGRSRCQCFLLLCLTGTLTGTVSADLLVAENSLKPWPSGHGESPPPIGSLVRLNASGFREVVATGLVDPVWVVGSSDGAAAYVGLFHSGEVVRVSLRDGRTTTVARGLSCPEGVALDDATNNLYVVENPVGDECRATFPIKKAAQLTRIDLRSGKQAKVVGLRRWACALCPALPGELQGVFVCTRWLTNWRPRSVAPDSRADACSSTGSEEGGPHGLAIDREGKFAYICDCPAHAASLTRVELSSGCALPALLPLSLVRGDGGHQFPRQPLVMGDASRGWDAQPDAQPAL